MKLTDENADYMDCRVPNPDAPRLMSQEMRDRILKLAKKERQAGTTEAGLAATLPENQK